MKKFIALILLVITLTLMLASCGNNNLGFGTYTFKHARVAVGGDAGQCFNISSWHDNELGIELHTTSGGSIYCAEGTYVLFSSASACPYC